MTTPTPEPADAPDPGLGTWFTLAAGGSAHRVSYAHDTDGAWAECGVRGSGATARGSRTGDTVCRECLTSALAHSGRQAVNLPEALCLGCGILRGVDGAVRVLPHETGAEPGGGPAPCAGAGLPGAAHDGRDRVRTAAVRRRAGVLVRIGRERADTARALSTTKSRDTVRAVADPVQRIMRTEAACRLWESLATGGDHLAVATAAAALAARDTGALTGMERMQADAERAGARYWLRTASREVEDAVRASTPEKQTALVSELLRLLGTT